MIIIAILILIVLLFTLLVGMLLNEKDVFSTYEHSNEKIIK